MSAFVVEDKTINRVIGYLSSGRNIEWIQRFIAGQGYDLLNNLEDRQRLAKDMFKLNCMAVDQRYGEGDSNDIEFTFQRFVCPSKIQAYKSLSCWIYQCSEGDVPETALFKIMDQVKGYLAEKIVSGLPEYDSADWG